MHLKIRSATESDLHQIHSIFTHYVQNTVVTFRVNKPPFSYIGKRFHEAQERGLPYLVAVEKSGQDNPSHEGNPTEKVCGYTLASAFRGYMLAYAPTVEMSLLVHPDYQSQGIGSAPPLVVGGSSKGGKTFCPMEVGDADSISASFTKL
ncbi:predicted protein [Histoplasma mississippiense (nom. inval.)]|uniref:predicted protein n=1 Tax=Ajellomyces capsulatus (strain NAm1 / WU24) TaxID=2059318 RepID=UPI000157B838|nr:predicted protein [Histoplasma mississippiense (nom. inval.)]EDN03263.1 predicted protein [Histoplasma mississippiense (nom. inval.)]